MELSSKAAKWIIPSECVTSSKSKVSFVVNNEKLKWRVTGKGKDLKYSNTIIFENGSIFVSRDKKKYSSSKKTQEKKPNPAY